MEVEQGEIVGFLGPNGAGKTTSFYMITGQIVPNDGKVFLDDEEITKLPMYKRAQKGIGYLPQDASVFRKMSVEDNIMSVMEMKGVPRKERLERLEDLIDEFNLSKVRKSLGIQLSGGERRRCEIARALAIDPKLIQEHRRHHHRPQRGRDSRHHGPCLSALRGLHPPARHPRVACVR